MEFEANELEELPSEKNEATKAVEELDLIEAAEITVGHAFHAFRFN